MPGARGKASVPEELDAHWAGKSGASRRDHAVSSRYFFGQNCFVKNPSLDQERAHSSATPRAWRQSPHPYTGTLFVRMNVSNSVRLGSPTGWTLDATASLKPGCPFCLPWMAPFIHPKGAERTKLRSSLNRPAPEAVTSARADGPPTEAPLFWGIPQTPLYTWALSSPGGLRCTRPRVSLPAPAAPRSSAACRRTAAGSDVLPPAGASSTARASRAVRRFSPAGAASSSVTSS